MGTQRTYQVREALQYINDQPKSLLDRSAFAYTFTDKTSVSNKLSEKELLSVASEVTDKYEQLAICLGFRKAEVDRIRQQHSQSGIQHVVFVMLVEWQQAQESSTDFRQVLAAALRQCKRLDMEEKVLKGM